MQCPCSIEMSCKRQEQMTTWPCLLFSCDRSELEEETTPYSWRGGIKDQKTDAKKYSQFRGKHVPSNLVLAKLVIYGQGLIIVWQYVYIYAWISLYIQSTIYLYYTRNSYKPASGKNLQASFTFTVRLNKYFGKWCCEEIARIIYIY